MVEGDGRSGGRDATNVRGGGVIWFGGGGDENYDRKGRVVGDCELRTVSSILLC